MCHRATEREDLRVCAGAGGLALPWENRATLERTFAPWMIVTVAIMGVHAAH